MENIHLQLTSSLLWHQKKTLVDKNTQFVEIKKSTFYINKLHSTYDSSYN